MALGVLATAAFAAGLMIGRGGGEEGPRAAAIRFVSAWERGDHRAMREELSPATRARVPVQRFRTAYRRSAQIATLRRVRRDGAVRIGPDRAGIRTVSVPVVIDTRVFGPRRSELSLPFGEDGLEWAEHLSFPGLQRGESLAMTPRIGDRGRILAADGTVLAEGPSGSRSLPFGPAGEDVAGQLGAALPQDLERMTALGYPPKGPVGVSGLERAFQPALAGRPGGTLFATSGNTRRQLAAARPVDGRDVTTTIRPRIQEAAVTGLASRLGGIAVLDTRTGEVIGIAGLAYSTPQPPGSTFKMITAAAALESGVAKMTSTYPVVTEANVGGRAIANAHDESCGGSLTDSFAHSCNSVFAPLGVAVGSEKLVRKATQFGFNRPARLFDAKSVDALAIPPSSLPDDLGSDLEVGVSAIGQGKVLATPLQMASVAQAIAAGGRLRSTPITTDRRLRPRKSTDRVMAPAIARNLVKLMRAVVSFGTGRQAALPGVAVAGKTGTAELGIPKRGAEGTPPPPPGTAEEQEVNAWFTAFAPADRPRVAIAVMLVNASGDGGEVAAPLAREVMKAALISTAPAAKSGTAKAKRG